MSNIRFMGIPGLFAWLIKKYRMIHSKSINDSPDVFYIDANCLFHPVCNKIAAEGKDEVCMIDAILVYIDNLIKIINPTKYTFVAVDGIPPLAKICQQRKRRYKAVHDEINRNNIKKRHNKPISNWSSINITPGTIFMEKLHKKIIKHYKNNDKIIYSSYHDKGEGEHKIMDHIRNNRTNKSIIIYGLDADLIILSMLYVDNMNVYLLRDDKEKLMYLHINAVFKRFNETISGIIPSSLNDIIFISYFLGNDFLPRIPTLDIRKNGGDILLNIYIECCNKYLRHIIKDNMYIDQDVLMEIFNQLSQGEEKYFIERDHYKPNRCFNDPYEKDMWEYENTINDTIKENIVKYKQNLFGDEMISVIKYNYYAYFFKTHEYQNETIDDLCRLYLEGLVWILEYYISGCKNWTWYYPYNHAPFPSDIYNFLIHNNDYLNKVKFKSTKNITMKKQLKYVIPSRYKNQSYDNIITAEQCPLDFRLDTFDNQQNWQCPPILPIFRTRA